MICLSVNILNTVTYLCNINFSKVKVMSIENRGEGGGDCASQHVKQPQEVLFMTVLPFILRN